MSLLAQKHLQNEEAAYAWVEARIWPNGAQCPHCFEKTRVSKMQGKATRFGLYKCYACRKQFRVTVGTIFEKSHVALYLWLQAFYLVAGSKKGISANQLHRTLGVTLKTAWFMGHRIREAMRAGSFAPPMGSAGEIVEIDETVIGKNSSAPKGRMKGKIGQSVSRRNIVMSLVQRDGDVRSFHVTGTSIGEIMPIINANVSKEAAVMTDSASWYKNMNKPQIDGETKFTSHDTVNHSGGEYARYENGRPVIHTNTVEGYYSIFKRGMKGVYQHCGHNHLHRYLAEFDFRYNNRKALGVEDLERAQKLLLGVKGKRLTYRTTAG